MLLRSLLFATGLVATARASSCANPVFAAPAEWGLASGLNLSFPLAAEPEVLPMHPSPCVAFRVQSACCSERTLDEIQTARGAVTAEINAKWEALAAVRVGDQLVATARDVARACDAVLDGCTAKLEGIVDTYVSTFDAAYASLEQARVRRLRWHDSRITSSPPSWSQRSCVNSLNAFMLGMMCFACEADFASYLDMSAKTITLADVSAALHLDRSRAAHHALCIPSRFTSRPARTCTRSAATCLTPREHSLAGS